MRKTMTTTTPGSGHHAEGPIDCIDVARTKLAKLEAIHERMRRVNALLRNRNARGLKDLGYTDAEVNRLLQPDDACPRVFYSDYKLKNNYQQNQAMRRLIRELEGKSIDHAPRDCAHYEYKENLDEAVISFRFSSKPDRALRGMLRRSGFTLSPTAIPTNVVSTAMASLLRSNCAARLRSVCTNRRSGSGAAITWSGATHECDQQGGSTRLSRPRSEVGCIT